MRAIELRAPKPLEYASEGRFECASRALQINGTSGGQKMAQCGAHDSAKENESYAVFLHITERAQDLLKAQGPRIDRRGQAEIGQRSLQLAPCVFIQAFGADATRGSQVEQFVIKLSPPCVLAYLFQHRIRAFLDGGRNMVTKSTANRDLGTGPPLCGEPIEAVKFRGRYIDGGQGLPSFQSARYRKVAGGRVAVSVGDLKLDLRGKFAEL